MKRPLGNVEKRERGRGSSFTLLFLRVQAVRLLAASDSVRGTKDLSQPDASRIIKDMQGRLGETVFAEATRAGQNRDWRELAEITLAW
jgi:hypothetical protein